MQDSWYIKVTGGVIGPFSRGELVKRLGAGSLLPETLVRDGVSGAWRELREVLADGADEATSSEAARRALAVKRRPAVGSRQQYSNTVSHGSRSVVSNMLGQIAGHFVNFLTWVTARVGHHVTLRRVLFGGLLLGSIIVIRASPVMDTSLPMAIANVELVWVEAEGLRDAETDQEEWDKFEARSLAVLQPISDSLVSANERPPGVWGLLWGTDEADSEARHDLIHLTRNELPASLATGLEGAEVRDHRIDVCLDRLRRYHDGQNPYALAANLQSLPAGSTDDPWVSLIVGLDVIVAGVFGWWWIRRRR